MTHPYREELAGRLEARARAYGQIGAEGGNDGYYTAENAADDLKAAAALRQSPTVEEVARVIDPDIFADLEAVKAAGGPWGQYGYSGRARIDAALAKAQAIADLYGREG